jgi:hypothetical protein
MAARASSLAAAVAGFSRTEIRHLAGPTSAAIAYKD